jgi:hypothetical protein
LFIEKVKKMKIARILVFLVAIVIYTTLFTLILWAYGFRIEDGQIQRTGGVRFLFPQAMRLTFDGDDYGSKDMFVQGIKPGKYRFDFISDNYKNFSIIKEIEANELADHYQETLIFDSFKEQEIFKPVGIKNIIALNSQYLVKTEEELLFFDDQFRQSVLEPVAENSRVFDFNEEVYLFEATGDSCVIKKVQNSQLSIETVSDFKDGRCIQGDSILDLETDFGSIDFIQRPASKNLDPVVMGKAFFGFDINILGSTRDNPIYADMSTQVNPVVVDGEIFFANENEVLGTDERVVLKSSSTIDKLESFRDNLIIITGDTLFAYNVQSESTFKILEKGEG